jgi:hypothetical protein
MLRKKAMREGRKGEKKAKTDRERVGCSGGHIYAVPFLRLLNAMVSKSYRPDGGM